MYIKKFCLVQDENATNTNPGFVGKDLQGKYNFMTEIFHITLRAMNIGFFPAWSHYKKSLQ